MAGDITKEVLEVPKASFELVAFDPSGRTTCASRVSAASRALEGSAPFFLTSRYVRAGVQRLETV